MSIMQDLHAIRINPFAVQLLAESVLRSHIARATVGKPQRIAFPVSRSDCPGWAGVRITVEAVPEADRDAPWPCQTKLQDRVQPWLLACFGAEIAGDKIERNHRFLEEALELVQALGCTSSEAHQLVDYTFGRPLGEPSQEVGGVMMTLAALCLANGLDMHEAGEVELTRIWGMVEKIRAKQAAKPKHSPLPEAPKTPSAAAEGQVT